MESRSSKETEAPGDKLLPKEGVLSLLSLTVPAYFLNPLFEIKWINQRAHNALFRSVKYSVLMDNPLFRVLCESVKTASPLILEPALKLHVGLAKRQLTKERFRAHLGSVSRTTEGRLIHSYFEDYEIDMSRETPALDIAEIPAGTPDAAPSRLCAITFREGTLFICEPISDTDPVSALVLDRRNDLLDEVAYF